MQAPASETRGYTGHEHLDEVNLIHMNGRIYDPQLGRMASPDPILQDPLNSQNYNRYSYVWNNPLKYTDPSGFCGSFISWSGSVSNGEVHYSGGCMPPVPPGFLDYLCWWQPGLCGNWTPPTPSPGGAPGGALPGRDTNHEPEQDPEPPKESPADQPSLNTDPGTPNPGGGGEIPDAGDDQVVDAGGGVRNPVWSGVHEIVVRARRPASAQEEPSVFQKLNPFSQYNRVRRLEETYQRISEPVREMCAGAAGVYCDNESISSKTVDLMLELTSGTLGSATLGSIKIIPSSLGRASVDGQSVRNRLNSTCIGFMMTCARGEADNMLDLFNEARDASRVQQQMYKNSLERSLRENSTHLPVD